MRKKSHRLPLLWTHLILLGPLLVTNSCSYLVTPFAWNFSQPPHELSTRISPQAQELINQAFSDLPANSSIIDLNVQLRGFGTDDSGTWINPQRRSFWAFNEKLDDQCFLSAGGVKKFQHADSEYLSRLQSLAKNFGRPVKIFLAALDKTYAPDGRLLEADSPFFVPNEYVEKIAKEHPGSFLPVISIHPYRKNALADLEHWGEQGIKYLKWLPSSMGINPADERILPFYTIMKKFKMVLISQVGKDPSSPPNDFADYANPLLLKLPLKLQIPVVVTSLASMGNCQDLEIPQEVTGKSIPCFDLLWRMLQNPHYQKLLYADLAGITSYYHLGRPLTTILENPLLHERIINGSDYPLPAFNILIRTKELAKQGLISNEQRALLNEIYDFNPLLFDFVVKRTLRHPQTKQGFLPVIFSWPNYLPEYHRPR